MQNKKLYQTIVLFQAKAAEEDELKAENIVILAEEDIKSKNIVFYNN